ncbi:set5 [Symbiodinium sp. CCMP2592]|nr:set5 [Symbiodinium sp. CCMP2592]
MRATDLLEMALQAPEEEQVVRKVGRKSIMRVWLSSLCFLELVMFLRYVERCYIRWRQQRGAGVKALALFRCSPTSPAANRRPRGVLWTWRCHVHRVEQTLHGSLNRLAHNSLNHGSEELLLRLRE